MFVYSVYSQPACTPFQATSGELCWNQSDPSGWWTHYWSPCVCFVFSLQIHRVSGAFRESHSTRRTVALQESSSGVWSHSQEGDVCKYLSSYQLLFLRLKRDLISGRYAVKWRPLTVFNIAFSTPPTLNTGASRAPAILPCRCACCHENWSGGQWEGWTSR